jgi:hypothetical protein
MRHNESSRKGQDALPTPSTPGFVTWHNGPFLNYTNTYAIFWGSSWTNQQFAGDKITSIQSFLAGFGGSTYANTLSEYGVSTQSTYKQTIMDNSTVNAGDTTVSAVGGHLCTLLLTRGVARDGNGFYSVYTTLPYPSGFLGWHAWTSCLGTVIHFALIYNLDNHDLVTDNIHHSTNAANLVNVTAHELVETITDPDVSSGYFATDIAGEVSDKCNFVFAPSPFFTLSNGSVFKLQTQWSNIAFSRRTGLLNGNGEPGCVGPQPPWPTATINGPTIIHQGQQLTYTATIVNGTAPYQYSWHTVSNFTIAYNNNTSAVFSPTVYGYPGSQNFQINVMITDAGGRLFTALLNGTGN